MNLTGLGGILLILIGIWGILTRKDLIRIVIAFSLLDTGTHLVLVSLGQVGRLSAPILDSDALRNAGSRAVIDPLPSALVLTAIVIGVAVTALMLTFAVRMYRERGSNSIDDYKDMRW
jgi:multicomponent Na+:H+ antiporter subunit C